MDTMARRVIKMATPSRVTRRLEKAESWIGLLIVDLLCSQAWKCGGLDRARALGRAHVLVTVIADPIGALAVQPGKSAPRGETAVAIGCPVVAEGQASRRCIGRPDVGGYHGQEDHQDRESEQGEAAIGCSHR